MASCCPPPGFHSNHSPSLQPNGGLALALCSVPLSQTSGSQSRVTWSPRGPLAMSGDVVGRDQGWCARTAPQHRVSGPRRGWCAAEQLCPDNELPRSGSKHGPGSPPRPPPHCGSPGLPPLPGSPRRPVWLLAGPCPPRTSSHFSGQPDNGLLSGPLPPPPVTPSPSPAWSRQRLGQRACSAAPAPGR